MGSHAPRPTRGQLVALHGELNDFGYSVSLSKVCRWFEMPRSSLYYQPKLGPVKQESACNRDLEQKMREVIDKHPSYGYRMIWAMLMVIHNLKVNRKRVYRLYVKNNWQIRTKPKGGRPRAQKWSSRTDAPNVRWAIDTTHIFSGRDGWAHLTCIIDCFNREIVGWRMSRRGISKVAAAALEDGLIKRGITANVSNLILRSDNGLIFGAKTFANVVTRHDLKQEFITPYTPDQNGMIERFFLTLKQESVWARNFQSYDQAFDAIANWIDYYNTQRPHSALGYRSPVDFNQPLAA